MSETITLSQGATSLTLSYVKPESIYPRRPKNYTEAILDDNSRVIDEAEEIKRSWELSIEVPLSSSELADLNTLYSAGNITLTEDWIESSVAYNVHFRNLEDRFVNASGNTRLVLQFQEL